MFPPAVEELVYRIGALLVVLAVTAVIGLLFRRRQGRARAVDPGAVPAMLGADDLGAPLGDAGTLVQFSTSMCTACGPARRVLGATAAAVPGVVHLEIDAEQRLDLTRRLAVRSTPTTFVLDGAGRVGARLTGAPSPAQVYEALALAGIAPATRAVNPEQPSKAEV
jgi:hypothetical protein